MRRSSADLPVRHTKSFDFLCTKTARGHLLLASGFLRSPAILVNVIFVAFGGHGDFPRAGNDHGKLGRGIVSGAGTLQLLDQLVQPLRNQAANDANNHAEHDDGHEDCDSKNVPSCLRRLSFRRAYRSCLGEDVARRQMRHEPGYRTRWILGGKLVHAVKQVGLRLSFSSTFALPNRLEWLCKFAFDALFFPLFSCFS